MSAKRAGSPGMTPEQRQWHEPSQSVDELRSLVQQRNELNASITLLVSRMRERGCPWSVIGEALGITKQAAQQRYGADPERPATP